MKVFLRHIILIIGIIATVLSFLYFGRQQKTYVFILLAGLLIATISFIVILVKDDKKNKIIWMTIITIAVIVQALTEKALIKTSYGIFINKNEEILDSANHILFSKPRNLFFSLNTIDTSMMFSIAEIDVLKSLFNKTGIKYIDKSANRIFYITYGALDIHGGVSFFYSKADHTENLTHIKKSWYF